jgi:hypothetical protein
MSNQAGRLDGATLLRNRMLEARGWRVLSVPVMTGWVPLAKQGEQAARDYYLLSLGVGPLKPQTRERYQLPGIICWRPQCTPVPAPQVASPG